MLVISDPDPHRKTSGLQSGGAIQNLPHYSTKNLFLGTPSLTSHFGPAQRQIKESSSHPISIVNYLGDCAGSKLKPCQFIYFTKPLI